MTAVLACLALQQRLQGWPDSAVFQSAAETTSDAGSLLCSGLPWCCHEMVLLAIFVSFCAHVWFSISHRLLPVSVNNLVSSTLRNTLPSLVSPKLGSGRRHVSCCQRIDGTCQEPLLLITAQRCRSRFAAAGRGVSVPVAWSLSVLFEHPILCWAETAGRQAACCWDPTRARIKY